MGSNWRGSATNTSKSAVPGQGEGVPSSRRRWEGGDSSRPGRDCAVPSVPTSCLYFSMALSSGQLGPLVREFGLGEEAATAAAKGDMGAFVKALQKEKEGEDKNKDKQEDMALD